MIKYKLEVDEVIGYCDYSESCKNLDQEEMNILATHILVFFLYVSIVKQLGNLKKLVKIEHKYNRNL